MKQKSLPLLAILSCFITLTGCNQSNSASSNNSSVIFSTLGGGLDGKGTQVIEWGEEPAFNQDMYVKVDDKEEDKEIKVEYQYDADNVGKIQDMNVVVEYKGKEYKNAYPILIDDTHSPEISYTGDTKTMVIQSFDAKEGIKVTDQKGDRVEGIQQCTQFNQFYKGYIIVYTDAADEEKCKKALQALVGNELHVEKPGNYKMTIRASDGHGNVTNKVVDLEFVNELVEK